MLERVSQPAIWTVKMSLDGRAPKVVEIDFFGSLI